VSADRSPPEARPSRRSLIGEVTRRTGPLLWLAAGAISVLLLALVLAVVDWSALGDMLRAAIWPLVALAGALFFVEGIATAARIRICTEGPPRFGAALRTNAWYVLFLVILPARLGEAAAVLLFRRFLGQNAGAAAMSIVVQRLLDVAVLAGAVLLLALVVSGLPSPAIVYGASVAVIAVIGAAIWASDDLLAAAANAMSRRRWRHAGGMRTGILRMVLQARLWRRHRLDRGRLAAAAAITLVKWLCNLGAIVALLLALRLAIGPFEAVLIAAAYNFLAVIPLQTIGGFGLGEVGLTGLLVVFGEALPDAAGASILVRAGLVIAPLLFWLVVITALAPFGAKR